LKRSEGLYQGTHDTYLYRLSEDKAQKIGDVEQILKQNAVDRCLFETVNQVLHKSDVEPIRVTPPLQGTMTRESKIYPRDRSYSRVCSFQEDCEYDVPNCEDDEDDENDENDENDPMNEDTVELKYSEGYIADYQKRIAGLFSRGSRSNGCLVYSYQEIRDELSYEVDVYDMFLRQSLDKMVTDARVITCETGDTGHLKFTGDHFIFQPGYSDDSLLPYYYRMNRGRTVFPDLRIMKRDSEHISVLPAYEVVLSEIESIFKQIEDWDYPISKKPKLNIIRSFKITDQGKYLYALSRLSYDDHVKLQSYLVWSVRGGETFDEGLDKVAIDYLKKSWLHYEEESDTYTSMITHRSDKDIGGFFVYHPFLKTIRAYRIDPQSPMKVDAVCEIDNDSIVRMLSKVPKTQLSSGGYGIRDQSLSWGFSVFSERKGKVVCVIVDHKEPKKTKTTYPNLKRTPGVIADDAHPGNKDRWSKNPFLYLSDEYKSQMDKASNKDLEKLETSYSRVVCSSLAEYYMWEEQTMLSQEMAWWWFS
jgi:hypothetical protein